MGLIIPREKGKARSRRPNTVSPLTESVSIRVNRLASQTFNVTPTSPGCFPVSQGTECLFSVLAPSGQDTFVVTTYSGLSGADFALDRGSAVAGIGQGHTGPIAIVLSPVVSNTSDSGPGSLRQAVANANPGDVITFISALPATIVLTSGPITLHNNVTIAGPGPSDLIVSGDYDSQVFVVSAGATVTLSGLSIERGSALQNQSPNGGGIYNAGTLTLNGDRLSGNQAGSATDVRHNALALKAWSAKAFMRFNPKPRRRGRRAPHPPRSPKPPRPDAGSGGAGGAVFNAGTLTVQNSTFVNNTAQQANGGAIYNAANATLSVSSSTFSSNDAGVGGAVDNEGSATFSNDAFSANSGWVASGSSSSSAWGYGAALYSDNATAVNTCTFSKNTAGGNSAQSYGVGGAIAQYAGSLLVTNSNFISNVAGGGNDGSWGYAGAIFSNATAVLTLNDDSFTSNAAGGDAFGYGGAIYSTAPISGSSDSFNKNIAYGNSSGGYAYAGAIYAAGGLTLNQSTLTANDAAGGSQSSYGYAYGGAVDSEFNSAFNSVTFTGNQATAGIGGSAQGGGVFLGGGSSSWQAVSFSQNLAQSVGSYSYAAGGAVNAIAPLAVAGGSFQSNQALAQGTNTLGGQGGSLVIEAGPSSLAASVINSTASTQGGGIWLDDNVSVANAIVSGNTVAAVQSPNDGGGGVYNGVGGVLSMTGTTVSGNAVNGSAQLTGGGGMFNAGAFTVQNSTITANQSSTDGGGFENAAAGGVALTNVTIFNNVAGGNGGNVKNVFSDAQFSIGNSIVAGGTAAAGNDVSNDGAIDSTDYNIIQTSVAGNALSGTTTHNQQVNPQLSSLTNNGGPTPTNADNSSSPAANFIPFGVCSALGIATDQRGMARNDSGDGMCDAGAFESQAPERRHGRS